MENIVYKTALRTSLFKKTVLSFEIKSGYTYIYNYL